MMKKVNLLIFVVAIGFFLLFAKNTWAVPTLQLYMDGAVYDADTESWTTTVDSPDSSFTIWAIGKTGPGVIIADPMLAIAYGSESSPTITLTPTLTGDDVFTDYTTPIAPEYIDTYTDGSVPKLSDGSDLPSHSVYGPETYWQLWELGDFIDDGIVRPYSPIADFIDEFPTEPQDIGQINAYTVTVSGLTAEEGNNYLHFDFFNSEQSLTFIKYRFAPFSHDAQTTVPEPSTAFLLLGIAIFAFLPLMKKKGKF